MERNRACILNVYLQTTDNIIHESGWAISMKCGNKVRKVFLHDAYSKIRKEVSLLELSLGKDANLSFDTVTGYWVCESDYLELRSILDNIDLMDFIDQLKIRFNIWKNDILYRDLIRDEWSASVVPWY